MSWLDAQFVVVNIIPRGAGPMPLAAHAEGCQAASYVLQYPYIEDFPTLVQFAGRLAGVPTPPASLFMCHVLARAQGIEPQPQYPCWLRAHQHL